MTIRNVIVACDYAYIEGGAARVAVQTAVELSKRSNLKVYFFAGCGEPCQELVQSSVQVISLGMYDLLGNPSKLDAMKNGIAYLPEDRKVDGIVGDLSVRDNIILAAQVLRGFFRPFSKAQANKLADEYIKLLEIKTASADTPIKSLSGGNQQKVILARWLLTHPEYLILDEPTRGIDIGTKIEIQKLVLKLASEGMSVTFISSETDEMLRTCSRLIVMRDRRKVGEISGEDLTQSKIMDTIAGGEKKNG